MLRRIPYNGKYYSIDENTADTHRAEGNAELAALVDELYVESHRNPLAFFLPHGRKWTPKERVYAGGKLILPPSHYAREQENDGRAFLNDWSHDGLMVVGPNQCGKSVLLVVWTALNILPMDDEWHCVRAKTHGLRCRQWTGPKTWVLASYSWDNVATLWKRVLEFFPRKELGRYAPGYGLFGYEDETGGKRQLTKSFGDGRPKELTLACGSVIKLLCYTQQQHHWESFDSDGGSFDEQVPRDKFVGWSRSTTTHGDFTPWAMALTGHVLADRPDTGKAGWIHNELWTGANEHGFSVSRYGLSVDTTPDAIITPKKKKELWNRWVNPETARSEKQQREAVARYWGGWEEGSGMFIDNFERAYHVINPLWDDDKVPKTWTLRRVIDFGDNGITSVAWFATGPEGYSVCYRLLYEAGLTVYQTCRRMIAMSHNTMVEVGRGEDEASGMTWTDYEEVVPHNGERYESTILDGRSYKHTRDGYTVAQLFERYGIEVSPAPGAHNDQQIPALKDMLRVDAGIKHVQRKNEDGTAASGGCRLYFVDGRTDLGVEEIESCQCNPNDANKIKSGCRDHFVDDCKYFASSNPTYDGPARGKEGEWMASGGEDDDGVGASGGTPYTGY